MAPSLLQAGEIVNAHGVHGEVKILPWAASRFSSAGVGRQLKSGSKAPSSRRISVQSDSPAK